MRVVMLVTTTVSMDTRVRREAAALVERGHDVIVLGTSSREQPASTEELDGFVVHRVARHPRDLADAVLSRVLPGGSGGGSSAAPAESAQARARLRRRASALVRMLAIPLLTLYRARVTWRLARRARALRPDVVHCHDADTLTAGRHVRRGGALLVYDAHELATEQPAHLPFERARDGRNERRTIPLADLVITVCDPIAEELQRQHGGATPLVVRNVADPRMVGARVDLRAKVGVPAATRLVIAQGIVAANRGLDGLVRSVSHLPDDVHAVIVGPSIRGTSAALEELALETGVEQRVHVLGPVTPATLLAMVADADLGVVLTQDAGRSYQWSLPNKLFEDLAMGIPVVATDLPEVRRVLEETGSGRLVPADLDPAVLAEAIMAALEDPGLRQRARDASTSHTWVQEQQVLQAAYDDLADRRARST